MAKEITEYERELIGSILLRPERMAAAVTAGVAASWFEIDTWSLMWSALEGYWQQGKIEGITPVTVRAEALRLAENQKDHRDPSGLTIEAIESAIESAGFGPLDIVIRLLRNAAIERATKKAMAQTTQDFREYADANDVVGTLVGRLDKILSDASEAKKISPARVFAEILAEYEEAYKMRVDPNGPRNLHWVPGVQMPWQKMTEMMGGLNPGLHIIAARPSVGKTAFAVNLIHFWCETGTAVLFCSLDMPDREVLRRYIAEGARVSARKAAFSPTRADLDAMREAVKRMETWPLTVVETRDVDDLRTQCMVDKAAGKLGVVVVDYLQLLHARALGREDAVEYARVSYVSDTLNRLANEMQSPVVALAQLNRDSTKGDNAGRLPGLSDLRGSGAIEQDAFTVAILHRDAATVDKWRKGVDIERAKRLIPGTIDNPAYRYNLDDIDPIWWVLCKAQNGPTGALPFVVRKKYFAWMLGDYEAEEKRTVAGYGSTAREVVDKSAKFERVHGDWRHDPIEEVLRQQLALIPERNDGATGATDDYPKI